MEAQTQFDIENQPLKVIFAHHLNRIYNGKRFLYESLPKLTSLASFDGLRLAMEEFGEDVLKQIVRMKMIYQLTNLSSDTEGCNPIANIVKDEFCLDENQKIAVLNDLDLMLYVQLLEHVNITSYRMLMLVAEQLKYDDVKQLLRENYDESKENDKLFTLIAKESIPKN